MRFEALRRYSSALLVRAACYLSLCALAVMAYSLFVPSATPVLLAMSLGQAMGVGALACYVAAIVLEVERHEEVEQALAEKAAPRKEAKTDGNAAKAGGDETRPSASG